MTLAAYLTTAFVAVGVGAWYLIGGRFRDLAKTMLAMGIGMIAIVAPLQIVAGDQQGLNVLHYQPAKVAAMEAHWHTGRHVPLIAFAWPDQTQEKNHYEITIPDLASLILTHDPNGEVKGLTDWPPADRPPVAIVFFAFRVMVAIGFLMAAIGITGAWLWFRGRLYYTRWSCKRAGSPRLWASSPSSPAGSPPKWGASPTWSMASCAPPMPSRRSRVVRSVFRSSSLPVPISSPSPPAPITSSNSCAKAGEGSGDGHDASMRAARPLSAVRDLLGRPS